MVCGTLGSISHLAIASSNTRNRAVSAFPACLAFHTALQPFGRVRVSGRLHQDTSGSLADVFRCVGEGHSVLGGMTRSYDQIGSGGYSRLTCQCTSYRDDPEVSGTASGRLQRARHDSVSHHGGTQEVSRILLIKAQ